VAPDVLLVSERTGRAGWDAAQDLAYRPAAAGEAFGPQWATYWFKVEATVPPEWAGRRVDLVWDSGSEATLWRDGEPLQGLASGRLVNRVTAPVVNGAAGGERVALMVEMACNDWMGEPPPPEDPLLDGPHRAGRTWREPVDDRALRAEAVHARLERCGLAAFDPEAWELAWDFEVLRQLEAEHARGLDPAWAGRLLAAPIPSCPPSGWPAWSSAATSPPGWSRTSASAAATPTARAARSTTSSRRRPSWWRPTSPPR
jgi:alpha-mannosidase